MVEKEKREKRKEKESDAIVRVVGRIRLEQVHLTGHSLVPMVAGLAR